MTREFLNQEIVADLLRVKEDGILYKRESQALEFKESFNLAGLGDYYRDFAAFSNNRGGYMIFGIKDRPRRERTGLSKKAKEQFDKLDPETVTGHLLDIFSGNIIWEHDIFKVDGKYFGVFYIHQAYEKPIICKKDEGKDQILKNGDIYYRYGGRTQRIQASELEIIINERTQRINQRWIDLVQRIGSAGPENAAILDTEKGLVENDSKTLVIDESLLGQIQWLKEGEFKERKGAKALKLVGNVHAVDAIEVERKIKEDQLKMYPLSATELVKEVKKRKPEIKQPEIYDIIKDNEIKDNKDYSDYIFRNVQQQKNYEEKGTLPKGITSIYKSSAVDVIVKIYENQAKAA